MAKASCQATIAKGNRQKLTHNHWHKLIPQPRGKPTAWRWRFDNPGARHTVQNLGCVAVIWDLASAMQAWASGLTHVVRWYLQQQKVDILFQELLTQRIYNRHVATNVMGKHNAWNYCVMCMITATQHSCSSMNGPIHQHPNQLIISFNFPMPRRRENKSAIN
jgi:hypothetical protein